MRLGSRVALLVLGSAMVLIMAPWMGSQGPSWEVLLHPGSSGAEGVIFWEIRVPRVLMAWVAGAGLAVAGMAFQAMFRNALATPFTLGVSSGASFGAALAVRLGWSAGVSGVAGTSLGAVAGAVGAIGIVHGLTRFQRGCTTGAMLLAGVAVNFLFSSLVLLLQYTADFHDTFRILRWLMGGLQVVGFEAPIRTLPFVLGGCLLLAALVGELNLLCVGEELATSRGVAVPRVKAILFLSMSCMVGVIVSFCGPVGFVGLMCPHICRLVVGPDHRVLLPATLLFGGSFLIVCDTVARTAFAPMELPVGILTSLLGGPFFLWILFRSKGAASSGADAPSRSAL